MKALITIEKPKCCFGCPCGTVDKDKRRLRNKESGLCYVKCNITNKETIVFTTTENDIPEWCPLKAPKKIPKRKTEIIDNKTKMLRAWENGWNACIDEILEETE